MRADTNIDGHPPPAYKIKLEEILLYVRKVSPSATCRLAFIVPIKIASVKYLIRCVEMYLFSIPGQVTNWTQENIMSGQLSHRAFFLFYENKHSAWGLTS